MLAFLLVAFSADVPTWQAGVAKRVLTPAESMWMAGYAARTKPAEGKEHDLYVKVLALQDPKGRRAVLLTSDLIGIPRGLAQSVRTAVRKRHRLEDAALMLTASHTHSGPVIADNLLDMYPMSADEAKKVPPYTRWLGEQMVAAIDEALKNLRPATLEAGIGNAGFAVNRRQKTDKGVINGSNPTGPVDHRVPVLRVRSAKGEEIALVFGYACHNTTLSGLRWCGDYAGFAQEAIEAKQPGTLALFWTGCGADANPLPRGKVEQARAYGNELAKAVRETRTKELKGELTLRYAEVPLPYDTLPTKEQLAGQRVSKNLAERRRAERLLATWERDGKLPRTYEHYPVQVWQVGPVTWIALGGEVVVDYALRLKKSLGPNVWVTAYANDVMAYIPSKRVLNEGGYEADSSQIYYGQPARWSPRIEEIIHEQIEKLRGK
jgi:hypothetical protein